MNPSERVAARYLAASCFEGVDDDSLSKRVVARYKSKKTVGETTVYLYSERQVALRNRRKAQRLEKLSKKIDALRDQVTKDLKSEDPHTALMALAVALIDHTFERVGNSTSADEGHYGVTGWQRGHISWSKGGDATIKYVGKSGVKHTKSVTDASILKALRQAYDAVEGDDAPIFSPKGHKVDARAVNEYLNRFGVSTKDLRGFHANREMQERLSAARKEGDTLSEDKKERVKQLKAEFTKALEETADIVGHEVSTLRRQYLVPGLEDAYLKDGTVVKGFDVKATYQAAFGEADVAKMRADVLMLMRNVDRVKSYDDLRKLWEGLRAWREWFDSAVQDRLIPNLEIVVRRWLTGSDEWPHWEEDRKRVRGWVDRWKQDIRRGTWGLSTSLTSEAPIDNVGHLLKYGYARTQEGAVAQVMAKWEANKEKWAAKVKREAREAWAILKQYVEWAQSGQSKAPAEINVIVKDRQTIDGFSVLIVGFDPTDERDAEMLGAFKEALHHFKQRASFVLPMMLRAMLPIELNFDGSECGLDKGGLYMSDRIRVCASMVGDNFKWLSHVVAHEMGHHLYKNYLSAEDQKFWSFAIGDDWGDLDLREILAMWPTSMHMSAFERDLRAKDPILSLQFEGLSSGIDPSFMVDWTKREDIEEYLAKGGQNPVKVPRNPITAYAMKNREEAFCEAVGLMVSYGPRALPEAVVSWLRQILPSLKVGMAHRVAARFLG